MRLGRIALIAFTVFMVGLIGSALFGFDALVTSSDEGVQKSETVELENASSVEAEIDMGVGELRLTGGADALMEGDFYLFDNSRSPRTTYKVTNGKGKLLVDNEERVFMKLGFNKSSSDWNIRLNDGVPVDLTVSTGAGDSELNLKNLSLQALKVDAGVGDTAIDLSGKHEQSFEAVIDGGVGNVELFLPKETGVKLTVDKGVGEVNTRGLQRSGNTYTNEAYGKSPVSIEMDLDLGVGDIDLIVLND